MSQTPVKASALAIKILQAVNLPVDGCTNVRLRLEPGEVARLDVTYMIDVVAGETIVKTFGLMKAAD